VETGFYQWRTQLIRIIRVTDCTALGALYKFRHRIYVAELGWLSDIGGVLVDQFDESAANYAAYNDGGEIIGSIRVNYDGSLGLPLERRFPLNVYRYGKHLAEVSRFAVSSDYRGSSRAGALLMKAAYQRCVASGISHMLADTYIGGDAPSQLYEKMGFERIGGPYSDPEYNCELPVFTLALDISKAHTVLPVERPGLWRFFTSIDPDIDHG
jgi:GNAT superfamily N-acetyltransferase